MITGYPRQRYPGVTGALTLTRSTERCRSGGTSFSFVRFVNSRKGRNVWMSRAPQWLSRAP
eukprot:1187129-Prorocentrum_minimum.AAC.1